MEVRYHKTFLKAHDKLPVKIQAKFEESIIIFDRNPFDQQLNNHSLKGHWAGYRSINITSDFRAVYRFTNQNTAKFYAIGTHSQLYG